MTVALLAESPLVPPADLGPYRSSDYAALPDEPRCELILGRIYLSPSPSPLHQTVASILWKHLDQLAMASGGLAFAAPLDVHLAAHSVVQPDVIYLSAARRSLVGDEIDGAPDLVAEILSPGTSRRDRGEKLSLYAQAGVREYWIVDPQERQIEILINEGGRFVVAVPTGDEYRSSVLPEIRLSLAGLWQEVAKRLP